MAIGNSFGANSGYAINPARDFGPRLFAYFAGWGKVALPGTYDVAGFHFTAYFWVPIVGPLIGGILGVLIYDLFIGQVLHGRLMMAEQVSGPIEETPPRAPQSGSGATRHGPDRSRAATTVPGCRPTSGNGP